MAAAVAGEVLGPRPGKAACSFTQGVVEIVLRSCSAVSEKVPLQRVKRQRDRSLVFILSTFFL